MLPLPFPRTRGALISFWLLMWLGGGIAMTMVAAQTVSWPMGLASAGFSLLGACSVFVRPRIAYYPYRAWNALGRKFCQLAERFLLWICFYVVLGPISLAGGTLALHQPKHKESVWVPRRTQSSEMYHAQDFFRLEKRAETAWRKGLWVWAIKTKHVWAITLFPFIHLLSIVQTKDETALPSDIYTLF